MPKDNQIDPRSGFVPRFLPWVLGGIMLCVFALTLNHWVTLLNINQVASVSGWNWRAQISNPILFLVMAPFRCLPVTAIPVALNLFSAICGAAALALLARSVAILPHDRTEMERVRERNDLAFLTGWVAWIPPVAAVLFAGLELGFWKNATSFTGETFELLLFAIILWQLLEYRLDEAEWRLYAAALVFGAGIVENWALLGFFPIFLTMLIWLRKLDFFNVNFLVRMCFCLLAGLGCFFILPIFNKLTGSYPLSFWQLLKPELQTEWLVLKSLASPAVRHDLALMSLTSLMPAFVMAIRWSASFGDSSRLGTLLVNYTMHLVNIVILGMLLWVTYDPAFSPAQFVRELGMDTPALTLYYVAALCIGYYCGYLLLIFGKPPIGTRRNPRPDQALPAPLLWLCPIIVAVTLAATVGALGLLLYKNIPIIHAVNDNTFLTYAKQVEQQLPPAGAIVLCDSDDPKQDSPIRAYLLQAILARDNHAKNYVVISTRSLDYALYHQFLHRQYPAIWPGNLGTNLAGGVSDLQIYSLLGDLSRSNNLRYLNPSYGYYFEQFYQEPHGPVYVLKTLPEDKFLPPKLDQKLAADNEAFWTEALAASRPAIDQAQHPIDYSRLSGALGWWMVHLHVSDEPNANALKIGEYYSRDLNFLGVQLQRAGDLAQAAKCFQNAVELNSNNVVAGINLAFNKNLQAGNLADVSLSQVATDEFGKYTSWNEVLSANGPFDEPSFCFQNGVYLMQASLTRQAASYFNRVRELAPNNLAARLFLAQIYAFAHRPELALDVLRDPLTHPARFALTEFNSTELNVLAASAHFQRNENDLGVALLLPEISRHPDNDVLLTTTVQALLMHHLYTNALQVIDRKLARSPDEPAWIYGKGFASVQIGAYHDAVVAFTHLLQIQSNNPDALFNRGYAYFQTGKLDEAREDFSRLQAAHTNNYQVAYGLGEIAWRQNQTNEALRNYQIFAANAPTNAPELKAVRERLTQAGVR